jgi:hypothetical protein
MDIESKAGEALNIEGTDGASADDSAQPASSQHFAVDQQSHSGDAAHPEVEDALHKVSTPTFAP